MKRFLLIVPTLLLSAATLNAQTLTDPWATLADNAGPRGITIDPFGNVYTANTDNYTVSKITPDGALTDPWITVGDGPYDVAVDASGNVYTALPGYSTVAKTKRTPDGTVTYSRNWALARNAYPYAIRLDGSGNVYIANFGNSTVSEIAPDGTLTEAWAILASDAYPYAIAIDGFSNVYTANFGNSTVSKITPDRTVIQVWATLANGAQPHAIAINSSGDVYTANTGNNTVSRITPDGTITQAWATLAGGAYPLGIAIDAFGNVYTTNEGNNTVSKITPDGTVTQAWATLAGNAYPGGIAIDASGNVYTANEGNSTVSKIAPGTLPVTLESFTGKLKNGMTQLQWNTSVEINFNHFEIQKSTDGSLFRPQGEIAAKGNNSGYTYSMPQRESIAYYRLKMVDNDGSSRYSDIILLLQKEIAGIMLYPNPATNSITIHVANVGIISIYNASGALVKRIQIQAGSNTIDIGALSAGVYYGTINGEKINFVKK